jgi:nickel-dependent lactate racemase
MKVNLAYGRTGLQVSLPGEITTVIEPVFKPGMLDEIGAIVRALREPIGKPPLETLVRPGQKVSLSVCDATRPMPTRRVLPPLLRVLEKASPGEVVIVIATGTHRHTSEDELNRILGPDVVSRYAVVDHSALDNDNLKFLGESGNGIPLWLNRQWLESDVKITVGFVEPHFFAGFSGGPKMVAPGLAGLETIMGLHSAELIGHPASTWGVTEGNPIHDTIREIAYRSDVTFSLDVTLNDRHEITGVYAGRLAQAHPAACQAASGVAMRQVKEPFDIVITSNSGYPLDLNLYQSIKGISAAARVVREGGLIICASECSDGIPEHGEYGRLLASGKSPDDLLEMIHAPGFRMQDQWQVQVQAQVQQRARVCLKSSYLSFEQVRAAHLEWTDDIEESVHEELRALGRKARICVLPQGPQTIPVLAG